MRRIANDRLAERDQLAARANALACGSDNPVTHLADTVIESVRWDEASSRFHVGLSGSHAGTLEVDEVLANVGYRPDASLYAELQAHQCYASDGPMKLAVALLGQGSSDCLDQTSCGPQSLLTTEPNFYILGSKSYGRNSNFLFSVGLEQIRELFTIIGGREDLTLYASLQSLPS